MPRCASRDDRNELVDRNRKSTRWRSRRSDAYARYATTSAMPGLTSNTTFDGCVASNATTPSARLVFASVTSNAGGTVFATAMRSPGCASAITTATSAALHTVVPAVTPNVAIHTNGPNGRWPTNPWNSTTANVTSSVLTAALNACL